MKKWFVFLLQVMFSSVLFKRLPAEAGISVLCVSPGIVQTNVVSILKQTIVHLFLGRTSTAVTSIILFLGFRNIGKLNSMFNLVFNWISGPLNVCFKY